MTALLETVKAADQDFEWYPTTPEMINAVKCQMCEDTLSIMDIGAGDGRVLVELAKASKLEPSLYAIEKSTVLINAWPENIIPVGTEFFEQNLACLRVDYIFCNPPYSEFAQWVTTIIEYGHAGRAFLVIPRRWKENPEIAAALAKRKATARIIYSGDFLDAERRARAIVDVVEVSYETTGYRDDPVDPFDTWFEQNVTTFDSEEPVEDEAVPADLAARYDTSNVVGLVAAFDEEYQRMQENYRSIFKLDGAVLRELSVNKDGVCKGLKKRIAGLKTKYWGILFDRLDAITSRLCAETKKRFLEKLTGQTGIAFTVSNVYSVVIWAIKNANRYFDEQLVSLFKALSCGDAVRNYKSNARTWGKEGWRFHKNEHSHYALDYRFVHDRHYQAIGGWDRSWDYINGLHKNCHETIGDTLAVLNNLGFPHTSTDSRSRAWTANEWQDFTTSNGETLVQVKAFKNGNIHFRFKPEAMKALNVQAGKLLGWLRTPHDVVKELGYSPDEALSYFRANQKILPSYVKFLGFQK